MLFTLFTVLPLSLILVSIPQFYRLFYRMFYYYFIIIYGAGASRGAFSIKHK